MKITPIELKALGRFRECCEDSGAGGHDVPKEMMQRLMAVGTVRTLGFGRHETTEFGDWLLAQPPEAKAPVLASPAAAPQPIIGRLMDQISGLPVLWGLNEPGALLRNSDVFRVLAVAGREQAAIAAAPQVVADERAAFEKAMNDLRFFPAELDFSRTPSPGGRDEYANKHLESCWNGWQARAALAAAPAQAQEPSFKEVGSFLYIGVEYVATSGDDPRGIKLYRPTVAPVQPVTVPDGAVIKAAQALLDEHKAACLTDPMYALIEMADDDEEASVSAALLADLFRALNAAPSAQGVAEDAERLRWLAETGARISWSMDGEYCAVWLHDERDGTESRPAEGYPLKCYDSWHRAIDAAIAAKAAS